VKPRTVTNGRCATTSPPHTRSPRRARWWWSRWTTRCSRQRPRLAESGYPLIAGMLTDGVYADNPEAPDIEFGLTRILDGIQQLIDEQA